LFNEQKLNRWKEGQEIQEKEKAKKITDRMEKMHVKIGRTANARSNKIKLKKEEKEVIIDEATRDWNNYIGIVGQVNTASAKQIR
jgi:hypothetical protein